MRSPLFVLSIFLMIMTGSSVYTAEIPDTDKIPESLEPWKPWVLHGEEKRFCPSSYNDGEAYRCTWPSDLDISVDKNGGRFTQQWLIFVEGWVPLPGGKDRWPGDVKIDGKSAPVVLKGNGPSVHMDPGKHLVEGGFVWDETPEMIQIPPASGLVRLSVNGRGVEFPVLDNAGRLWLHKREEKDLKEARVETQVCRLLKDSIPMEMTTYLKMNVSGRAREIKLGGILLDGLVPMSIESSLPARLAIDGQLMVQARPGRWEIHVLARSEGPVHALKPLEMPYGEEMWAFQSQNHLRMVKVEGVVPIDPTRTDIPSEWKKFPTFIVRAGDHMVFKEIRRGDPDPAPDQLHLKRTWWLDFDGGGFTIQDKIQGTMSRQWYLAMNPPVMLGHVSVDGLDQLITSHGEDGKPGVELRRGRLDLVSESRFEASTKFVPAVGWDHDFQSVSGLLNLPPGWRLLTARGVDVMPGTWFARWTLLDLFVVLIISLSVYKLWGWPWGALALFAVGITYHEPGAPRLVWLHILAATALLRVLPEGWVRKLVSLWRLASFVTLLVLAVPFMVNQVRWGIYPQLEPFGPDIRLIGQRHRDKSVHVLEEKMAAAPAEKKEARKLRSYVDSEMIVGKQDYSQMQQALMVQDPNALIQTGPGLPHWTWRPFELKWNGPVERSQHIRIWLLSPSVNFVLAFVRVILLAVLIYALMRFRKRNIPQGTFTFTAVLACMLLIPGAAAGEAERGCYPSKELLNDLKQRLLEKPDCLPECADSPRMEMTVKPHSLHILFQVHAAVETAVPLPGSLNLWRPEQVFLNSRPATGLSRDKEGLLWLLVPEGIHAATLVGRTPPGNSFDIPLPLKPKRVTVQSAGWDVQGVGKDGSIQGDIKLIRQEANAEKDSAETVMSLPPFLHIERVLSLGLNWQVWTTVKRATPPGIPVVVSVPLIQGESVTTAEVSVEDGKANVNMGPTVSEFGWISTLEKDDTLHLEAPSGVPWTETWILDVSPVWHCEFEGLPVVHHQDQAGQWRPQWRPWPGEKVTVRVTRPKAIPGQSVTIDSVKLTLTPGQRFDKAELSLKVRSSKGGQHKIVLPEESKLQGVMINGKMQPIRESGLDVIVPLSPGSQTVDVGWHQGTVSSVFTKTPKVGIGEQAVNADVIFQMPRDRWILLTKGPCLGPAVLFWSYLVVIIIAAVALGQGAWTPLKTRHWLLLGLGLTQVHPLVAILIVGWLIALGLREKHSFSEGWFYFNVSQFIIVIWTIAALIGLYVAVKTGLLGIPNMQISGNGSSNFWLHWTQDRIGSAIPVPWVFSLPLFVYRILMLMWALWLAYALLNWLLWGWKCFGEGGMWRKVRLSKRKGNGEAEKGRKDK